ncbi:addiction module toxin, HicA family [Methanophagales archaeon]|nr:MAG: addiction module toxin, HicA family [Methanophagales archaeon]
MNKIIKQIRQKRGHLFMRHPDGRTTLITVHPGEDIGKGMIRKIISDAKLTRDEWFEQLDEETTPEPKGRVIIAK